MKIKSLSKIAKACGYSLENNTGGRHHSKYVNKKTGHKIPVPSHGNEIKDGTASSIMKLMGYKEPKNNEKVHISAEKTLLAIKIVEKIKQSRQWKKDMKSHLRGLQDKPEMKPSF